VSERSRAILAALAAFVVAVVAVVVRVAVSGRDDLRTAESAAAARLEDAALDAYARAARWYLPFGSSHAKARQALESMGRDAADSGRDEFALRCFRELRGAILATRWLVTPDRDALDRANREIARLMALRDRLERGAAALSEAEHLALLERDLSPDPWLSALAVALFLAWVLALARGAWRGVLPDGTVRWKVVGIHAAATAALLVLWLVALRLA
jgi:hypothetical protein